MNMADVIEKETDEQFLSHEKIVENLKNEQTEDFLKIFSIIQFDGPKNQTEAKIFINHLTNHPNPVREAVAIMLEDIFLTFEDFFLDDFSKTKILNAIVDINPNVSRAICSLIKKSDKLKVLIEDDVILQIKKVISDIKGYEREFKDYFDNKIRNTKNHAKNKKLFALYWLLEALSCCMSEKNNSQVLEILKYTINFQDYTIREKTAKILAKLDNPPLELLKIIKSDQNFYVKIQVYDKINFDD